MEESPLEFEDGFSGESNLLSFIIHLWKEESTPEEYQTSWRGHITPVPNGRRHYFTDINDIPAILAIFLEMKR